MTYMFDKPNPGESLRDYLIRHKAHPSCPDRRAAEPDEENDVTQEVLEKGFVIQKRKGEKT